jgi:hypothetical protein
MKFFSLLALALLTQISLAAPRATETQNIRELAVSESKNTGKATKSATDAQVPGMLKLKDPRPEVINRPWNYFSFFSGQLFRASGTASRAESGSFDLNQNKTILMSAIGVGIKSKYHSLKQGVWSAGLLGRISFSSQSSPIQLASGFKVEDARLNSSIVELGPQLTYKQNDSSQLAYFFSPLFGTLNYTQTSANELATFSKNASLYSMSWGVDYSLNDEISIFTDWTQHFLNGKNDIAIQKNNFELGTRITW